MYRSVSQQDVHDHAHAVLQMCFDFVDYGVKCSATMLISLVLYAAARATSVSAVCGWLRGAPSDETARQALLASLPQLTELERRINAGLTIDLPPRMFRKAWNVAVDLHEIPYYGQPQQEPREIRRRKPKQGTTRFHTYATACIVVRGYRFTVAATWMQRDEALQDVLQRLLQQVRRNGLRIKYLLLDREFYNVDIVRYLQAANCPFITPVVHRGRAPKNVVQSPSTRRFRLWRKSGWSTHRWRNSGGRQATVDICVSIRRYWRKGKRRDKVLVFACWKIKRHSPHWIREAYRKRFGIETSYRQLGQARIRTSTRDPLRRFLFVGVALILRNVWVWIHLMILAKHQGNAVSLKLSAMTFDMMLHAVEAFLELTLKCPEVFDREPHAPPGINATTAG